MRKPAPTDTETVQLVRETLETFVRAVTAQDMGPLRTEASVAVQRQLTVAEINETFRPFFGVGVAADMLDGLEPTIHVNRHVGQDGLVVEGYFSTAPQHLAFRLSFVREGLVWRWSYIHVALLPVEAKPGQ